MIVDVPAPEQGFIAERRTKLMALRDPYLFRSYKYSAITIPSLLPDTKDPSGMEFQIDFSTVGAEYVNHLANMYIDEMFPIHRCFFKLQSPAVDLIKDSQQSGLPQAEIESLYSLTEREARYMLERKHARVALMDLMKNLICNGNSLLYVLPDDAKVQNYAMDEYVLKRDPSGNILELITDDKKALSTLDSDLRDEVIKSIKDYDPKDPDREVLLLTYIRLHPSNPNKYVVNQAVESVPIGSTEVYDKDLLPWIPCVWNRTRREHWGRGLVEDHYGAFYSLSILMEALVAAGVILTDYKFLVKPGSIVDILRLNSARSGTYHYGNPEDVALIDHGRNQSLEIVLSLIDQYRKQLGKVFLVLSSQLRDAERVTAEENRLRAQELNKAHGGVFGNLALTLQAPMSLLILRDLNVLLNNTGIKPVILTGLDAMGRASENEKYLYLFQDLSAMQNVPEEFRAWFKGNELLTKLSTGRDVDTSVIKSIKEFQDDQRAVMEQQAQMQAGEAMVDKASPEQLAETI